MKDYLVPIFVIVAVSAVAVFGAYVQRGELEVGPEWAMPVILAVVLMLGGKEKEE